jgi:hypothetical protein
VDGVDLNPTSSGLEAGILLNLTNPLKRRGAERGLEPPRSDTVAPQASASAQAVVRDEWISLIPAVKKQSIQA